MYRGKNDVKPLEGRVEVPIEIKRMRISEGGLPVFCQAEVEEKRRKYQKAVDQYRKEKYQ